MPMLRHILLLPLCFVAAGAAVAEDGGEEAAEETVVQGYRGRWHTVRATAYSPHDRIDSGHWSSRDRITANGTNWQKKPYGIAVPYRRGRPLFVPYGTRILVPRESGYLTRRADRVFIADDTGGVITRFTERSGVPHIDFRYKTEASAFAWGAEEGRRDVRVFVISGTASPAPPVQEPPPPPPRVLATQLVPRPQVAAPPPPAAPWRAERPAALGAAAMCLACLGAFIRLRRSP